MESLAKRLTGAMCLLAALGGPVARANGQDPVAPLYECYQQVQADPALTRLNWFARNLMPHALRIARAPKGVLDGDHMQGRLLRNRPDLLRVIRAASCEA